MKKRLMVIVITCLFCFACSNSDSTSDTSEDTSSSTTATAIDSTSYADSVASSTGTYSTSDIVDNTSFDYTIDIDFTANTAKLSSSSSTLTITTDGVTPLTVGSTTVTIAKTSDGISVTSTVDAAIRYNLSGTLSGTFVVSSASESDYPYQLYLDGAIINATSGPAFDLESSQKVFIVAASGTVNTLNDSATRTSTKKASLYGLGPMIFSGSGTLSVTGSYKHGIFSDDYIRVRGTTLNVAVSAKDAVRSVNAFIFDDGNLTISATGTATDDESKGIKVEGAEDTGAGKGYIVINGGYITITSVGKAITAAWDIDEDAETADTSDDPDPYVVINNGVITITTTGTPYETTTASCSPEGIEGKSSLTINDGYLTINTTEDSLNAGGPITINGGYLYLNSDYDAIDANGILTITGGVIVAIGGSSPEGPFDCDNNSFIVTGGTFVGIGGTTSQPASGASTQTVVVLGSITSGSAMALKDDDGNVVFAFEIPQSFATMVLSSPQIVTGTKYSIYTGGTVSAENVFNGLYLNSLDYEDGTSLSSFTVSSIITKLGGVYF